MACRRNASTDAILYNGGTVAEGLFTLMVWGQIVTDRNNFSCFAMIGSDTAGSDALAYLGTGNDGTTLEIYIRNFSTPAITSTNLTVGRWYCLCLSGSVAAGQAINLFIYDSVTQAITTASGTTGALGTWPTGAAGRVTFSDDASGDWLNGRVTAGKLWEGVALTVDQFSWEKNFYMPVFSPESAYLIAPMRGSGDTVDYSGNGRTFTHTSIDTEDGPPIRWAPGGYRLFGFNQAAGGQVFTQTLTDTLAIDDPSTWWLLRNRLGDSGLLVTDELISAITGSGIINTATLTDAILAEDQALVFILRNRQMEDTVTVSEPGVQRFWFLSADSEVTVGDEVAWFRRIFRLLDDGAELIDLISASVTGAGTVFTGNLSDAIVVSDQALTSIERNRLLEDAPVIGDDIQAWALRNRLGEDTISADDDGIRYAFYLRQLEDVVEISDALIVSYLPFVDTYVTNPVLLGAMPNPIQLGAGQPVVLH